MNWPFAMVLCMFPERQNSRSNHGQFCHDFTDPFNFLDFFLKTSQETGNQRKTERVDIFNQTAPGVGLGDGSRKAIDEEGLQNRLIHYLGKIASEDLVLLYTS